MCVAPPGTRVVDMNRPLLLTAGILGGLLALAALTVGGFAAYLALSGTPLIDEWQCKDDEAPVLWDEGPGGFCEVKGGELPADAHWDPLGNRPLVCEDRWGWVEVFPVDAGPDAGTDCYPKDRELPAGWQRAGA